MCHCLADTEEELFDMMDKIGVDRKWYQTKNGNLHFDISLSMRAKAVRLGAVEITWKQAAAMNAIRRMTGVLGDPRTAISVYLMLNKLPKDKDGRIYWFDTEGGIPESGLLYLKELAASITSNDAEKEKE
jgi:hypothetical protein